MVVVDGELAPFHGISRSVSTTVERVVDESTKRESIPLFPTRLVLPLPAFSGTLFSRLDHGSCYIRFLVGKMRNDYCEEGDISGDLNERPVSFFLFKWKHMFPLYDIIV